MHPVPLPWVVAGEYKSKLEEHSVVILKQTVVVFFLLSENLRLQTASGPSLVASTTQRCVGLGAWLVFSMRSRQKFYIFVHINVVAEMFTVNI